MLILGVTNPDVAAEIRVLNTFLGAGVGVAFNVLYPPAMPTRSAGQSVLRVAEAAAAPLDAAGQALAAGPVTREQIEDWLSRTRTAVRRVATATDLVTQLRESRPLNPRALGTVDVEPVLATGLDNLEACLLAIRGLFQVMLTQLPSDEDAANDQYGEELRSAFAVVLHDVADCLRAFGHLVVAEAEDRKEETEQALDQSLEILRETQAILTELIMVDAQHNTASWLLHGSILAAVEQVLAQLDLESRARVHQAWREEQARRPLAQLPPIIEGIMPHPDRPFPRGLQPDALWRRPLQRTDTKPGEAGEDDKSEQ